MTQRSRDARRRARLKEELLDELGLRIPSAVLAELDYALRPPAHEGHRASYGAVVPLPPSEDQLALVLGRPRADRAIEVSARHQPRLLADGYTSFYWVDSPPALLIRPFPPDNASVARFARETYSSVVRRSAEGVVSMVLPDGTAIWEGGWRRQPGVQAFTLPLALLSGATTHDRRIVASLAEMCLYWLSPDRVGATLVWDPEPSSKVPLKSIDRASRWTVPPLDLLKPPMRGAVKSLLSQVDRAVLVSHDGTLTEVGLSLAAPVGSGPPVGGTRHTSARDFSAAEPRAVVFVVSSDGPVSLFRNGERLVDDRGSVDVVVRSCRNCDGQGYTAPKSLTVCDVCHGSGRIVVVAHGKPLLSHRDAGTRYQRLFDRMEAWRETNRRAAVEGLTTTRLATIRWKQLEFALDST